VIRICRSAARASILFGVALVLASCATTAQHAPPARPNPTDHSLGIQGDQLPLIDGRVGNLIQLPWQVSHIDRGTNRVYLSITGRGCSQPEGVAVAETAGTITIAAYGSMPGTAPCTAQAVTLVGYITTRSPIAARRIVHAT
jgi:hypothetical protein